MSLTEKQKQAREHALGSSDAPVVTGVSPYASPLELYYKLHGELPRYSDEETESMEWGSRLENSIATAFAEKTGAKIRRIGPVQHKRLPFLCANLDYEIIGTPKGPGVLEVKTRDRHDLARWESRGIPDDITVQVAHQLAVTNRAWAKVAVLFGGNIFRTYDIERDQELEEYLIDIECRFMLRVQQGEPPDHTWTPETLGILKKLYPTDSGKTLTLPQEHVINIQGFLAAKKQIEAAEETKALYEGLLKSSMGDASVGVAPGYKITWKNDRPGQKFDFDQFEKEHPELVEAYMKPKPGARKFIVRPAKDLLT